MGTGLDRQGKLDYEPGRQTWKTASGTTKSLALFTKRSVFSEFRGGLLPAVSGSICVYLYTPDMPCAKEGFRYYTCSKIPILT